MKRLFLLCLFLLAVIIAGLRFVHGPEDQFALREYDIEAAGENAYIVRGRVENEMDRPYENAQIGAALLSAEGQVLATAEQEAVFVDARATWDFAIPVQAAGATHFRIEKLLWKDGEQEYSFGPYKVKEIE